MAKSSLINARFTPAQKDLIAAGARAAGLTVSDYMRRVLLNHAAREIIAGDRRQSTAGEELATSTHP